MADNDDKPDGSDKNKIGWFRQIFSDDDNRMSSFRVMAMIAMLGGLGMLALDLTVGSESTRSYELVYVALFGGAMGGKAFQKHAEKK